MYKAFTFKSPTELQPILDENPSSKFVNLVHGGDDWILLLDNSTHYTPKGLTENTITNTAGPTSKQIYYLRKLERDAGLEVHSEDALKAMTKTEVSKMINKVKNGKPLQETQPDTNMEMFNPEGLDDIDFS